MLAIRKAANKHATASVLTIRADPAKVGTAPMNGPWLRLLRLSLVAALRRAGPLPWLLLSFGVAWSALLEPAILRRSGLPFIETSAHALGLLLLLAITSGCSSLPQLRDRIAVSGLLACGVAVAETALAATAIALRGQPLGGSGLLEGSMRFLLAWWPVAATLSAALHGWRSLFVCCAQIVCGASVATFELNGSSVLLALLSLGSVLAIEPSDPSGQYANRYSW